MSSLSDCCEPCAASTPPVNVPGSPGATGAAGASAKSTVAAPFVVPAVGATVSIATTDTSWMQANENLFIGGANFTITSIDSAIGITIKYLGLTGDTASGAVIAIGAKICPGMGNNIAAVTLNSIAALTDNTTGTPGNVLSVNTPRSTLVMPMQLADLVTGQTWKIALPFAFTVLSALFRTGKPGTGAGAVATLTVQVNEGAVGGGVMNLTLANQATTGGTVAATAITGASGSATQNVDIAVSAVTTSFTGGDGYVEFTILNKDMADSLASISSKLNSVLGALV